LYPPFAEAVYAPGLVRSAEIAPGLVIVVDAVCTEGERVVELDTSGQGDGQAVAFSTPRLRRAGGSPR
jgi:hypothetical protein